WLAADESCADVGIRAPIDERESEIMKPDIYQIIEARRQWHYQVSPEDEAKGFRGWHSRGYLPHFDAPGTQQFLTWRLADSLPASRRGEWEHLLRIKDERDKQIQLPENGPL